MSRTVPSTAPHPVGGPTPLVVDGLRVAYPGQVAIAQVALRVEPGRWTAIIGPNGAGKTSLLHAITGAVAASGAVSAGGDDLLTMPARERARRVALVPQRPVIPDAMTVFDYVLLGRTAHLPYLAAETAADLRIAADVVDRLELTALAHRAVQELSGGEQQRVVLARALAQQTPVLLLDEPTAALDIGHRQQVLALVDQLRRECELTVLAAMHDLTLAAQHADRLVLLDGGRVAAAGPPAQVLTRERIARHFHADVRVVTSPDGDIAIIPTRSRPPDSAS